MRADYGIAAPKVIRNLALAGGLALAPDIRLLDSRLVSALSAVFTIGSLLPKTLLARKAGAP